MNENNFLEIYSCADYRSYSYHLIITKGIFSSSVNVVQGGIRRIVETDITVGEIYLCVTQSI